MPTHPTLLFLTQVILAILVGLATSYQPGVNAAFASFATSKLHGGVLNFAIGLLAMLIVCALFRTPMPDAAKLASAPWWVWTGGLLGAFFVTMAIFLVRPMGGANYFAAMIAGQFIGSMVIDHFGHVGLPVHPFSWGRAVGLLLMTAGIACIRWF